MPPFLLWRQGGALPNRLTSLHNGEVAKGGAEESGAQERGGAEQDSRTEVEKLGMTKQGCRDEEVGSGGCGGCKQIIQGRGSASVCSGVSTVRCPTVSPACRAEKEMGGRRGGET